MGEMITLAAWLRLSNGCPASSLMCLLVWPCLSTTGGDRFLPPTSSDKMSVMEKDLDRPPLGLAEGDWRLLLWLLLGAEAWSGSAMENCGLKEEQRAIKEDRGGQLCQQLWASGDHETAVVTSSCSYLLREEKEEEAGVADGTETEYSGCCRG